MYDFIVNLYDLMYFIISIVVEKANEKFCTEDLLNFSVNTERNIKITCHL